MATKDQIKIIHTLKSGIGLSDDNYRTLLDSYFAVTSSTSLTMPQGKRLIEILNKMNKEAQENRFNEFDGRYKMATGAQLRMLESMWIEVSNQKTIKTKRAAFVVFLSKRFKIDGISAIVASDVGGIRATLGVMKKQKAAKALPKPSPPTPLPQERGAGND